MLIDDLSKSVDSTIKLEYDKLYGTYEWDIPIVNRKHIFSDIYYQNLTVKYFDESESEYVILTKVYYKKDAGYSDKAWLFVSSGNHTATHSFCAYKSNNECSDEIGIFKKIKRLIDSDIEEQQHKNALYIQAKIEKRIKLLNPDIWGTVAFVVSWIVCRLLGV